MTKLEEWCIYSALLTDDWKQAYLASHPNSEAQPHSLYKMIQRWQSQDDVKQIVAEYGYVKQRVGNHGRTMYLPNYKAQLDAISRNEEYVTREYDPDG